MSFKTILAAGVATTVLAASLVSTADARPRHHHHGYPFAAGAFGFAAGALIGSALTAPRYPYYYYNDGYYGDRYYDDGYYYQPAPRVYYSPAPAPSYSNPCDNPGSKPAWAMC